MGETKEVNGIICIPLPAMTEGNHVLSTTYTDTTGKYQTENKCFNIKVISADVTVTNHTTAGKPDCTINLQIGVKNELGQNVNSGKVYVLYENTQTNPSITSDMLGDEIGVADVVNGVANVRYVIPSDFRAGQVFLRLIYNDSEDGYSRKSIASAFYIKRDGDLKLDVYNSYDSATGELSDPIDEWNNIRKNSDYYFAATLYDDTDSDKIPLKNVGVNLKLNEGTITTDVNDGPVQVTDDDGVVFAKSKITSDYATDTVMFYGKSEAKQFVGEVNVNKTLFIAKHCDITILNGGTNKTKDGVKYDLYIELEVRDTDNQLLSGRPVGIKLNNVSLPENGDFENPDRDYEVTTDANGKAIFAVDDISLSRDHDYMMVINVGGGKHIFERKADIGFVRWNSDDTVRPILYPVV